jgi:hypothetical protein
LRSTLRNVVLLAAARSHVNGRWQRATEVLHNGGSLTADGSRYDCACMADRILQRSQTFGCQPTHLLD